MSGPCTSSASSSSRRSTARSASRPPARARPTACAADSTGTVRHDAGTDPAASADEAGQREAAADPLCPHLDGHRRGRREAGREQLVDALERVSHPAAGLAGQLQGVGREDGSGRPEERRAYRALLRDARSQLGGDNGVGVRAAPGGDGQLHPHAGQPVLRAVTGHGQLAEQLVSRRVWAESDPCQPGDRRDSALDRLAGLGTRQDHRRRGLAGRIRVEGVGGQVAQLREQPRHLRLERPGLLEHRVDGLGAGDGDGRGQRGAQPAAELGLEVLGGVLEGAQQPGGRLLGLEVSLVVRDDGAGQGLRRREVSGVLVSVVVEQQLDVVGEPRGQSPAQCVDEVGDGQLQLRREPLAVDRLRPEARLRARRPSPRAAPSGPRRPADRAGPRRTARSAAATTGTGRPTAPGRSASTSPVRRRGRRPWPRARPAGRPRRWAGRCRGRRPARGCRPSERAGRRQQHRRRPAAGAARGCSPRHSR